MSAKARDPEELGQGDAAGDRLWRSVVGAAIPHVLILLVMALGVLGAEGADRGYVALYGWGELYVVPVAAAVALGPGLSAQRRTHCPPVILITLVGATVVSIATLIVGNGDTWS